MFPDGPDDLGALAGDGEFGRIKDHELTHTIGSG
jgi:hypothetical protein